MRGVALPGSSRRAGRRATGQRQRRRTRRGVDDADVLHEHAVLEPGADGFRETPPWRRSASRSVPARVNGRRAALARSTSVKTRFSNRSPNRSSEFWIRSILHRSEPRPMIKANPPCGEAMGRGTVAKRLVEGQHRLRQSPSVSASRCQPPLASRQGGTRGSYLQLHPLASSIRPRIRRTACFQPVEDRLADQIMADVEFGELRDRGDRRDILEGQAMPGMRLDAVLDASAAASAMRRSSTRPRFLALRNAHSGRCATRRPARPAASRPRSAADRVR